MKLLIIHGPNFPFLGKVSATTGTRLTLDKVNTFLRKEARKNNIELKIYQLYSEEKIVKAIARSRKEIQGILISPGALALCCPALVELLEILKIPTVEIHLAEMPNASEVYQKSNLKNVVQERVIALGLEAYRQGFEALVKLVSLKK